MRFFGIFFLVMGLWVTGVTAEEPTPTAEQEEKSPEQKAMDQLAEAGLRQALQAIQRSGSFYPFGLVQSGDENVQAVGYSGDQADAPSPKQWAEVLFMKLQEVGKEKPDIELMALFRLHEITGDNGEKVAGIWAQVDHRDVRPWVIFLPLLKNDEGKHELGDMVYYATEQPLFEESGE